MKKDTDEKVFNMYDYIGKGKTIYDVMDKYLEETDSTKIEDYSLPSLIKQMRSYFEENDIDQGHLIPHQNQYIQILGKVIDNLKHAINEDNLPSEKVEKILSSEEKEELLGEFQKAAKIEGKPEYDTIEEYLEEVKSNPFGFSDPFYKRKGLTNKIIDASISVTSESAKNSMRHNLLFQTYGGYLMDRMRAKYPDRAQVYHEDLREVEFIHNIFIRPEKLNEYDNYVNEFNREMEQYMSEKAFSKSCQIQRLRFVTGEIEKSLTEEEREKAIEGGINSVIFERPNTLPMRENTFKWELRQYEEPKVILDDIAKYSQDGKENQRVIAISYGNFCYSTMFNENHEPTMSSEELELVGVTRLGKDGNKNYFVLMPFKKSEFKKESELTENDKKISIFANGVKQELIDGKSGEILHLVQRERIPEDLRQFYAKVIFSDDYLENVISNNYRYAGAVANTDKGPKVDANYVGHAVDIEAAKYAQEFSGKVGKRTYYSLKSLLSSTDFLAKHLNYVKAIASGEYEKVENKKVKDKDIDEGVK